MYKQKPRMQSKLYSEYKFWNLNPRIDVFGSNGKYGIVWLKQPHVYEYIQTDVLIFI